MRLFSNDPLEPGVFAVGQFVTGIFVLGQFGRGVFVIGQFAVGVFAVGQFAVGLLWAFGQFAVAARARSIMGSLSLVPKLRWPWEPSEVPPSHPLIELTREKSRFAWGSAGLTRTAEFESEGNKVQVVYTEPSLSAEVQKAAASGVTECVVHVQNVDEKTTEEAKDYRETPKRETFVYVDRFIPIQKIWRGMFLHPNEDEPKPIGAFNAYLRLILYVPFVYAFTSLVLLPILKSF